MAWSIRPMAPKSSRLTAISQEFGVVEHGGFVGELVEEAGGLI